MRIYESFFLPGMYFVNFAKHKDIMLCLIDKTYTYQVLFKINRPHVLRQKYIFETIRKDNIKGLMMLLLAFFNLQFRHKIVLTPTCIFLYTLIFFFMLWK